MTDSGAYFISDDDIETVLRKRDKYVIELEADKAKLLADLQHMIKQDADGPGNLTGYRELGEKCAALEQRAEAAEADVASLRTDGLVGTPFSVRAVGELRDRIAKLETELAEEKFMREITDTGLCGAEEELKEVKAEYDGWEKLTDAQRARRIRDVYKPKEPVCKTCEDREEICIKVYELQPNEAPNAGLYLERLVEIPCPTCGGNGKEKR